MIKPVFKIYEEFRVILSVVLIISLYAKPAERVCSKVAEGREE